MSGSVIHWFRFSSPATFYPLAGRLIPIFWTLAALLGAAGLWIGFFVAPTDATQGEGYRIIFVHVPVSWMSMFIYLVMATWAGIGLVFNTRLSSMMAQSLAPTGALMAFLSLWTGAFWGKPMWGTWWVWDARLTSVFVLFLFYLAYMALRAAIDDEAKGARAAAILALVGLVNVPVVHWSVEWWNTLHQGRTVFAAGGSRAASVFLVPLFLMSLSYMAGFGSLWLVRIRGEVWRRRAAAAEARLAR